MAGQSEKEAPIEEEGQSGKSGDLKAASPEREMNGADILIAAVLREGVDLVFGYPGGASLEIHQAITRSTLRNVLCRHEQGEIFAAEGYAKASGKVGVCVATSGPGATNLVTGLADAKMDSVPLVAITGQVPSANIGRDAFQETPIIEITRQITKHNYLIGHVDDIGASSKRPSTSPRPGDPARSSSTSPRMYSKPEPCPSFPKRSKSRATTLPSGQLVMRFRKSRR